MALDDIVGYTYKADNYCPKCVYEVCIIRMELKDFDLFRPVEEKLDRLAKFRKVDRTDEASFDSGDFPKIIFRDQAHGIQCGKCGTQIRDAA